MRPDVQALWRACHPADKQRRKPSMMWSNQVRKLLPSDAYARLLPEKGGRYHALDVQEQVLLVHGPGTHPHIIADLQQRVEAEAWRLHSHEGTWLQVPGFWHCPATARSWWSTTCAFLCFSCSPLPFSWRCHAWRTRHSPCWFTKALAFAVSLG